MLELRYYSEKHLNSAESEKFLKFFGKGRCSSVRHLIMSLKEPKLDWIDKTSIKDKDGLKRDLKDLASSFADSLEDELVSFKDKLEFVLEKIDIVQHFPEFEFSKTHGGICPECGKKELFIPEQGKAKGIKCSRENKCGFHANIFNYLKEYKDMSAYNALSELASLVGVDLKAYEATHEHHIGDVQHNVSVAPKVVNYTPKIETFVFDEFNANHVVSNECILDTTKTWDVMSETEQFTSIVTRIYRFSKGTKQWGKYNWFKAQGISGKNNHMFIENVKHADYYLGFIHKADLPTLVKELQKEYPQEDLIKCGIIFDKNHKYPYSFAQDVQEGLIVIPSFDLYKPNNVTGLKLRKTKIKEVKDTEGNVLWKDKNKEPELTYGRINDPLPFGLTFEALLNPKNIFNIFEGMKDGYSLPFRENNTMVAIPGVNGLAKKHLGYFKGRKVVLWLDQDEAGKKGSVKLAELLREAGAIVESKQWNETLGKDVNDVLQNGNIQKLIGA